MSQIEQSFRQYLSRRPEVEKCYADGLINRRALVRHLIDEGIAEESQFDALVAMLRRFEFASVESPKALFTETRMTLKDKILIVDFAKDKELLKQLQKLIAHTDYDKGDTLKIVVGSSSIKAFIDQKKEPALKPLITEYAHHRFSDVAELSVLFPDQAMKTKGILATITREFAIHDIPILELLTASPELLIYVSEDHALKAYDIVKGL